MSIFSDLTQMHKHTSQNVKSVLLLLHPSAEPKNIPATHRDLTPLINHGTFNQPYKTFIETQFPLNTLWLMSVTTVAQ